MINYWRGLPKGDKKCLRLLTQDGTWLRWETEKEDPTDPSQAPVTGCMEQVQNVLSDALHSTNVIVLLGSGASFSAKNEGGCNAPGMWDLWNAVKGSVGEDKFSEVVKTVFGRVPKGDEENIEALLSLCKMSLELLETRVGKDTTSSEASSLAQLASFVSIAEQEILTKVDFVTSDTEIPAHENLIRKFSRRTPEKPRVKLFTTNYDLCIEMAALRLGVVLIDGFSHSAVQRFSRDHFDFDIVRRSTLSAKSGFLDGVFHLYKLHGSVDWRRRADQVVVRSIEPPSETCRPVLIYPRSTKYQEAFATPYLDMFASLQAALREPDTTLIVSGFGFADDHISAPIWSAIETNLSMNLILCDTCFVPHERDESDPKLEIEKGEQEIQADLSRQKKYQKRLIKLVQQGDTRITILNGRFEDLADAFPTISGRTDRQLLNDRLDNLREGEIR